MRLRSNSGFTLLELLLAISISVVIIVILFAALNMTYKSQERGLSKAELNQRMRIIGDRISWLIRGTYPFFLKNLDEQKIYFKGENDNLGFVTTSIDPTSGDMVDRAGLKWVSIYLDGSALKIREKFFFDEDAFDDKGGTVFVVDPDVKSIEFEYLDVSEETSENEWVSEWDPDDKDYLPKAVMVRLTFVHKGIDTVMPEMIVQIHTEVIKGL